MAKLGGYLILFAVGSALLSLVDRQFILMMWIDVFGQTAAWVIRGIMIAAGIGLLVADPGEVAQPATARANG